MKTIFLLEKNGWLLTILLLIVTTATAQAAPGDLDATFAGTGKTRLGFGFGNDFGRAVAVQSDGKLIVAGQVGGSDSGGDIGIVRYNADNSLDASFGTGGKVITPIAAGNSNVAALRIDGNGKIVVAGSLYDGTKYSILVVRYNADGSLDTSFDADGIVTTLIAGTTQASAMINDANGKIVVVVSSNNSGGTDNKTVLVRYNTNGSLDTSFDGDGVAVTSIGVYTDVGTAVAIETSGKIVVAGYSQTGSENEFAVVRYNSNGTLDTSYGFGGKMVVDVSSGSDTANAIALDSSGRAVLAGESNGLFGIVRILGYLGPTAAAVSVSGRVLTPDGRGLTNALVSLTDTFGNTLTARTGSFGYYRFGDVAAGQTCVVVVQSKRYEFVPQVVNVVENIEELNFVPSQKNDSTEVREFSHFVQSKN